MSYPICIRRFWKSFRFTTCRKYRKPVVMGISIYITCYICKNGLMLLSNYLIRISLFQSNESNYSSWFQEVSNIWEEFREYLILPNDIRKCMVEVLAVVADPLTQNVFLVTKSYPTNIRQHIVSVVFFQLAFRN